MAVTNNGNRVILAAVNDAITGKFKLRSVILDHTAAITCVLKDTADNQIVSCRSSATLLTTQLIFPENFWVDGVKATTLSAGTVTLIRG